MPAILLTDVVDSTQLTQDLGDERMAEIWIEHDRIARNLLLDHGGREADRTDGFLMLFEDVHQALAFASSFHQAMDVLSTREGIDFRARIGIHVGDVILIENSEDDRRKGAKPLEVEGINKPLAARIMSLAGAGQTTISRQSLQNEPESFFQMGFWQLKGVDAPTELLASSNTALNSNSKAYEVVLKNEIWIPVREIEHNLSAELDSFVGREKELATLSESISQTRLLTVLGTGGAGKTRISRRFAWNNLGRFPGGIFFIDLVDARNSRDISLAMAAALGIERESSLDDQIVFALNSRENSLVILDNFEQLTAYASETLAKWMRQLKTTRFIVTSRMLLNISGEQHILLDPMNALEDGVELFIERSISLSRAEISETQLGLLREIVSMLDGLPLAIELAAARTSILSLQQIKERLSDRFRILSGQGRGEHRHKTLRATLDWSWNLLEEYEQAGLLQLSVFKGGFDLVACEAVIDLSDFNQAPWIMDVLQGLIQKSWIRRDEGGWMTLLVSMQEYLFEKQSAHALMIEETRLRHVSFYEKFGELEILDGLGEKGVRGSLVQIRENLEAAAHFALNKKLNSSAIMLLDALYYALQFQSGNDELHTMLQVAKELELNAVDSCRLSVIMGRLESGKNYAAQAELAKAAYQEARNGESSVWMCRALLLQADAENKMGNFSTAEQVLFEALDLSSSNQDHAAFMFASIQAAALAEMSGQIESCKEFLNQALPVALDRNDLEAQALIERTWGHLFLKESVLDKAEKHFLREIELLESLGERTKSKIASHALAQIYGNRLDLDRALPLFEQVAQTGKSLGDLAMYGISSGNIGHTLLECNQVEKAKPYLDEALAIARKTFNRRPEASWLHEIAAYHAVRLEFEEAIKYNQESILVANEVGLFDVQPAALQVLAQISTLQNNLEAALGYANQLQEHARQIESSGLKTESECFKILHQVRFNKQQGEDIELLINRFYELMKFFQQEEKNAGTIQDGLFLQAEMQHLLDDNERAMGTYERACQVFDRYRFGRIYLGELLGLR